MHNSKLQMFLIQEPSRWPSHWWPCCQSRLNERISQAERRNWRFSGENLKLWNLQKVPSISYFNMLHQVNHCYHYLLSGDIFIHLCVKHFKCVRKVYKFCDVTWAFYKIFSFFVVNELLLYMYNWYWQWNLMVPPFSWLYFNYKYILRPLYQLF